MAVSGRDIKAFLTLDYAQFQKGIAGARSSAAGLKRDMEGLNQGLGGTSGQTRKLKSDTDNLSRSMDGATKATKQTGDTAKNTSNQVQGLGKSFGLLKAAAGLLIITLGMDLAMRIMEVGNAAVNAGSQIRGMARGMGWSSSQVTAYTDEMDRLQSIYRKTDMNTVGMEVAKMARIYKLNADEAKDFIETSAVFSSAMAMEGRSARDSALALKDLIDQGQGWERRLSEIGVTGDALKKTGLWSGDKDDKKGLIAALNKVLEDRSLSQMAREINTLDDAMQVLTIAGGQLLGAFLVPAAPYLIAIAGALADLAYGAKAVVGYLTGLWNNLPDGGKIGLLVGGLVLFGGVLWALQAPIMAYIGGMGIMTTLTSIWRVLMIGVGAITWPLIAVAAAIAGIVIVVYEVGKAMGWWNDISTMGQAIWTGLGRIWAALANNPHIVNLVNQIRKAWAGLVSFFSPLTNFFGDLWNKLFPSDMKGQFDIVRSIIDGFGWLGDTISWLFGVITGNPVLNTLFTVLLYMINPIMGVVYAFEQLGELLGLWTGWGDMFSTIGGAITTTINTILGVWQAFVGSFFDEQGNWIGLVDGFKNVFTTLYTWITNIDWMGILSTIWDGLSGLGGQLWTALFGGGDTGGVAEQVIAFLTSIDWAGIFISTWTAITDIISQYNPVTFLVTLLFGDAAGAQVTTTIQTTLLTIMNVIIFAVNLIRAVWTTLSSATSLVWNTIWSVIWGVWNRLVVTAQTTFNYLKALVTNPFNTIKLVLTGIWDKLKSGWNTLVSNFKTGAQRLKDAVLAPVRTVYNALVDLWNLVTGGSVPKMAGGSAGGTAGGVAGPRPAAGPRPTSHTRGGVMGGLTQTIQGFINNTANRNGLPGRYAGHGGLGDGPPRTMSCDPDDPCYAGWGNLDTIKDKALAVLKTWPGRFKIPGLDITSGLLNAFTSGTGALEIFDMLARSIIGRTHYEYYYDARYSDAEAIKHGAFNCWDGMEILLHLAQRMGLPASVGRGSWGNDGHVWAVIAGKIFDTTAYQHGYGWKSPKVRGYVGAGPSPGGQRGGATYNISVNVENAYGPEHFRQSMKKIAVEELVGFVNPDPNTGI